MLWIFINWDKKLRGNQNAERLVARALVWIKTPISCLYFMLPTHRTLPIPIQNKTYHISHKKRIKIEDVFLSFSLFSFQTHWVTSFLLFHQTLPWHLKISSTRETQTNSSFPFLISHYHPASKCPSFAWYSASFLFRGILLCVVSRLPDAPLWRTGGIAVSSLWDRPLSPPETSH